MSKSTEFKENVVPSTSHGSDKQNTDSDQPVFSKIRQYFEREISKKSDNPIDFWLKYIEWSDQLYSTEQISKKEASELYNQALTNCKLNKSYQNDPRLLKMFLGYINKYLSNKLNMLNWMYEHKYCVKLAQFYIEWSKILEPKDKQKSAQVLSNALKLDLEPEQACLLSSYWNSVSSRFDVVIEESNPSNESDDLSANKGLILKFAFSYSMLKPDKKKDEEFSFEEIRARKCYEIYNEKKKTEQFYLSQIDELKQKLAIAESKVHKVTPRNEISTNTSISLQDSTITSKKQATNKTYNTTVGFNNTNLTNVTRFNNDDTSDMELSDDEVDFKENKSLVPLQMQTMLQPPKQLSTTSQDSTMMTITNIRDSMMTTMCDATSFSNKTITMRTHVARKNAENMFNETAIDPTNSVDNNTSTDTLPTIPIYQDNQTLSSQVNENKSKSQILFNQENETQPPKPKKINHDGSLFVYDPSKSLIESKRQPLGVIADSVHEIPSFTTPLDQSDQTASGLTGKHMAFDPAMASTRSIKPLLKHHSEFFNHNNMSKLETIIDSSFEIAVKKEEIRINDEEKEKLLSAHLGVGGSQDEGEETVFDDDKNMSKLLAQDFATQSTQWANCVTSKTRKQVKFNIEMNKIEGNVTRKNSTNVNSSVISWDYDFLEVDNSSTMMAKRSKMSNQSDLKMNNVTEPNQSLSCLTIPNITIANVTNPLFTAKIDITETNKLEDDYEVEISSQDKINPTATRYLDNENLEKTFVDDYYKLFYNQSNNFNNTTLNVSKVVIDKLIDEDDEIDDKEHEYLKDKTVIEEDEHITVTTTFVHSLTTSITSTRYSGISDLSESRINGTLCTDANSLDSTSVSESITNTSLNKTVMTAIREPFNIEIKNRLLEKGPIHALKMKPNFVSLKINTPLIKEKGFVTLKDGSEFRILEEIGKGSFAKIYLIEKNDKKHLCLQALKVDKQATSWEYYITETLHERLVKMQEDKSMKVNVMSSFIRMNQFMKYQNGCFSAMDYYPNGSLLDLINFHVLKEAQFPQFPYWFVLYLTLEMLYIVQYLHKAKIIHADIKPDNLIVNLLPDSVGYFDPERTKCLVLIDFNRSIDLNLLGKNAQFDAKVDNKSLLIPEMKEEKAWTYQLDFYGILCSIHCVAFKKYMKTYKDKKDRNRFTGSFPRGYDSLFESLFDTYLNVPSCDEIPDLDSNFIGNFKRLFLTELTSSFGKSKNYLNELNQHFSSK